MLSSYIITTIVVNVLIFAGWIWLTVMRYQEGRGYYAYGTIVYSATYGLLVWRNLHHALLYTSHLDDFEIMLTYFIYVSQLAATITFIVYGNILRGKK